VQGCDTKRGNLEAGGVSVGYAKSLPIAARAWCHLNMSEEPPLTSMARHDGSQKDMHFTKLYLVAP